MHEKDHHFFLVESRGAAAVTLELVFVLEINAILGMPGASAENLPGASTEEVLNKRLEEEEFEPGEVSGDDGADSVLDAAGIGYTSVTSSIPSSKYTRSCIVSWWYSTISLKNLFSRA